MKTLGMSALPLMAFLLVPALSPQAFGAQDLQNPRLQKSLADLSIARQHLDAAIQIEPPELREGARDVAGRVDGAMKALNEELAALHTPRQIEPARAEPTDRPIHASRDVLAKAMDDLTRGVKDEDIHGRIRIALDQMRAALDVADRMARREDALPPPRRIELREPHLQRSLQLLEAAREHLDAVEHHAPREWRNDAHQAREDIDTSIHEVQDSLAAAGIERAIEAGHAEPTDHPIHAARDEIHHAIEELSAVSGAQFRGHEHRAIDRAHLAQEELDRLVRHE